MKTVLVASSKGGVGKTTIATHLAAESALAGRRTVLVDADPQGPSTRWAERRCTMHSAVLPIDGPTRHTSAWRAIPEGTQRAVSDAPAGARADALVVPVLPSALDIDATGPCLSTRAGRPRIGGGAPRVGRVGHRLRRWTNASQQAMDVLRQWPYPLVAELRDSQGYVMLVGFG